MATFSAAQGQTLPTTTPSAPKAPATRPAIDNSGVSAALKGRNIEAIRVVGNLQVSSSAILNQVRTREGEPFDPATVEEDYKRIYDLHRFSNVEAKVEPTETGVTVSFVVYEQKQVKLISYKGNVHIDTMDIQEVVDIKSGESIDPFRIAMARQAIERLYRDKNYTYVQVKVDEAQLAQSGEVVFNVVEGAKVRVRRIAFDGNASFSNIRLRGQVKTDYYIWIFRAGQLDFEQVEDDVASLRKFYNEKGFFDAKIGRNLQFSADQSEVQVTFVIEEGRRYQVGKVSFTGIKVVTEAQLLADLKMVQGISYDNEIIQRDVRQIVKVYSPFGYVYQAPPATPNPDYLHIDSKTVFHKDAGIVDVVYEIHEGKPFHTGRILVTGNSKTQDKVLMREMHVAPGQLYNSSEINDAADRLKGLGYFNSVTISPVGEEPDSRDVLIEVIEGKTASFNIGAGISSNGGVAGEISYEQRNFDIGNWPTSWRDMFSERALTGAGQTFRIYLSPSTSGSSAGIRFVDPYLFDQPYIFSDDLYYRQRVREDWDENRAGDRASIGRRLGRNWVIYANGRAEDVAIKSVNNPALRAPEILEWEGHTAVWGIGPSIRYDTTNRGPILYKGVIAQAGYEYVGLDNWNPTFNKWTASLDQYFTLHEDLFDRKTVLAIHSDVGYIDNSNTPMFERFYAGGMGSVRGFKYRGISPRRNAADQIDPNGDPIGGLFEVLNSAELSYPIYADIIRGVFFVDSGATEETTTITKYRIAAGFGFRVVFPFAQNAPLAIDFGFPVVKAEGDELQLISFSFGVTY